MSNAPESPESPDSPESNESPESHEPPKSPQLPDPQSREDSPQPRPESGPLQPESQPQPQDSTPTPESVATPAPEQPIVPDPVAHAQEPPAEPAQPQAPEPIHEPLAAASPEPEPAPPVQAQSTEPVQAQESPPQPPEPADPVQAPEVQAQAPEPAQAQEPTAPQPTLWQTLRKATGHSDELDVNQQIARRTFVSFSAFALLGATAWKSWFWIKDAIHADGVQKPLRHVLNLDDKIFKHTLSPGHLAKTYPREQAARNVRYNSPIGLGADPEKWRLQVTTADNRTLAISLDELKTLPKTDYAFEFKCIEGWSQISWWGGVRFSDFIQHYNLTKEVALDYVGLSTPDDKYYVGIDTPSAMHPQTILAYEMTGQPLPTRHGAPLRLIIPIKYGVKNLKCIGKLFFSNDRPRDYWFERGYDYYCGL